MGTSLVVQWLRLCACNAGDVGSIPGWGTKIPHASWCSQKIIYFKKNLKAKLEKKDQSPLWFSLSWRPELNPLVCSSWLQDSFFFLTFYFVLGYSLLTILWWFQANKEGTQPYMYMYLFSLSIPSHPGCHVTLGLVPSGSKILAFICTRGEMIEFTQHARKFLGTRERQTSPGT